MNSVKIQYFEKVENCDQKNFMLAENNCILCGHELEIQHIRINENMQSIASIKEEACCAHCQKRARVKIFTLN